MPSRLRRQAAECAELADMMSDPHDRDHLLKTQRFYLQMADDLEAREKAAIAAAIVRRDQEEAAAGDAAEWTIHYFDQRLNRSNVSRSFSSEDDARLHACDLMRDRMLVNYMVDAKGGRIGPAELIAWCKAHRTAQSPVSHKRKAPAPEAEGQ